MNPSKLEGLLRQRYGEVKRQRGKYGLELIVRCPICKKKKLSVNANNGKYQCWHGCVTGHVNQLFRDIREAEFEVQETRGPAKIAGNFIPPGELFPLVDLNPEHQVIQYLRGRGFDPKELDQNFGLRYCGAGRPFADGRYNTSNTVMIPVYCGGELIAWQSRLLYNPDKVDNPKVQQALGWKPDEKEPGKFDKPSKYFTMPGVDKGKILYNMDNARAGNLVVVVEGAFDCMAVGRSAVATFGKGVTQDQMRLAATYWDLIVLLLDPDAMKEAEKLYRGQPGCILMELKNYHDAGDCPRAEIWRQIDQTIAQHPVLKAAGKTLDHYRFII